MKQEYRKYTRSDMEVWALLFKRQMKNLESHASARFLEAVEAIGFTSRRIPDFSETNKRLKRSTGWKIEVVPGIIPPDQFFKLLSMKRFPSSTWLRKLEQLDYLEEPDMFHDAFGHLPLLTNAEYCEFFSGIASIALRHINEPRAMELLTRLYWFTIEFGLILEDEKLKVYGAGLISSAGETLHSLSEVPRRMPYQVEEIFNSPFRTDIFQEKYFMIRSFDELYASLDEVSIMTDKYLKSKRRVISLSFA